MMKGNIDHELAFYNVTIEAMKKLEIVINYVARDSDFDASYVSALNTALSLLSDIADDVEAR